MSHRNNNEREFEAFLAGEESGLARLYRRLPQTEPDARLDAAVLAMARAAVEPQRLNALRHAKDRHRRPLWLVGLSSAAGIVLAAGLVWQMRGAFRDSLPSTTDSAAPAARVDREVIPISAIVPPPEPPPEDTATTADAPVSQGAAVPTPAPAPASPPVAPAAEVAKAAPRANRTAPQKREVELAAASTDKKDTAPRLEPEPTPEAAAAAPSRDTPAAATEETGSADARTGADRTLSAPGTPGQRAQPFPGTTTSDYNSVERKAAIASGTRRDDYGLDADAGSADPLVRQKERARLARESTRERSRTAGEPAAVPAPPPVAAAPPASVQETAPGAIPKPAVRATPASPAAGAVATTELQRNARLAPDDWIKAIRELLRTERKTDAIENLELFRRLHPDHPLPEDLRTLRP
ncbi:MAG: hypothetical protein AMXMBFR59_27300 [Rhodanobacteraceae bacterium]